MSDFAFVRREACGCVSAIVVQDDDTLHYIPTVAAWKRAKTGSVERLTVEQGREELTQTFRHHPAGSRRGWKAWQACPRRDVKNPRGGCEPLTLPGTLT